MEIIKKIKDKTKRHVERHTALDYQYIFSDSINFISSSDWDSIAENSTIFLSRKYLETIEENAPENTTQKYAVAYSHSTPVVIVACQIAEISGARLIQADDGLKEKLLSHYNERVLVCGNLVSSGLHGVAFANSLNREDGWRITAEILYKIRRSEKLSGQIDFVLIKDIKAEQIEPSQIIERFSYRRIQTDPDMVLDFEESTTSFEDYLTCLTSKYRSRINRVIKNLDQAGFECPKLQIDNTIDKDLHKLYLEVEKKSQTRLATLPVGYFLGLYNNLGDCFICYSIKRENVIVGFISIIKDGGVAIAYYIGIDYNVNSVHPIYFRLLQLGVQAAIEMGCTRLLLGRTALEPKANLGANPVDTFVWARHRVPLVNFIIRKLFRNVPFDVAPERNVKKKC